MCSANLHKSGGTVKRRFGPVQKYNWGQFVQLGDLAVQHRGLGQTPIWTWEFDAIFDLIVVRLRYGHCHQGRRQ